MNKKMAPQLKRPRFFVLKTDGTIQTYTKESDMLRDLTEEKFSVEDKMYEVGAQIFVRMKPHIFRRDPVYNRTYQKKVRAKRAEGANLDD